MLNANFGYQMQMTVGAVRSATELKNGAAMAAPPRPRRKTRRFMCLFML